MIASKGTTDQPSTDPRAGALGTGQLVAGFLNGASPFDPVVFAAVGIVLLAAAAVSMVVPIRRAVRVDPMVALRND